MTYFETLKKLIKDFRLFIWNIKFYSIFVVWFFASLILSFEPFFASKAISFVENYIKTWWLNFRDLMIFFIIWWVYIVFSYFLKFLRWHYLIDVENIKYYSFLWKKYKEKLIKMHEKAFINKKWWTIYKKFESWINWIYNIILSIFFEIFISIVNIILITIIMLIINVKMAFITLWVVPILIILWYYFWYKTATYQEELNEKRENFYWKLWDYFSNLTLVKSLTFEKNASNELDKMQDENKDVQIPLIKKWSIADVYVWFITNLTRFLVIGFWVYFILNGKLDFATLFLFFSYISYIYEPIWFIFSKLKNTQKDLEWVKRFYEEFDNAMQDDDFEYSKEIRNIKWKIEFRDVWFKYLENWRQILKNLSFLVNPWEKVALVWATWSWKTTISKLLFRFFEVESWEISVDWINIKNVKKSSLRKHIWIVIQDSSLFNTTIKENMLFAKETASDEEILIALKKAKADFVFRCENWIETIIWERWLKLSGWEKQRLNIARIFLKNPEILILDEATSALDTKTEIEIQKSLDELLKWKTSIIIAHRLSTIKKVDKIFVIDEWVIVESWNYEELIKKWWKFYELANPDKLMIW